MSGLSLNRGIESGEGPNGDEGATNVADEHVPVLVVLVLDVRLGTGRSSTGLSIDLLCLNGGKVDLHLDLQALDVDARRSPGPLGAEIVTVERSNGGSGRGVPNRPGLAKLRRLMLERTVGEVERRGSGRLKSRPWVFGSFTA